MAHESVETLKALPWDGPKTWFHDLSALGDAVGRMPRSLKVLLEDLVRRGAWKTAEAILERRRSDAAVGSPDVSFLPARVLLQDFTGVPLVVDLAAMRDALARLGGDPARVSPSLPVDLVIDHSVQVDRFAAAGALEANVAREFERNRERYAFLRWGQRAFARFRVVPPGTGICHQVNLEYLASVVWTAPGPDGRIVARPDTLVGTDSHTTMVNALGVLGWGVGGIEAEAAMLGHPMSMLWPEVVGVRLTGGLRPGVTATDLVLTVTETLRRVGVVGRFVEFFGPGLDGLPLPDRATIANMAPEYGATVGFFPVDDETLAYLRFTGRPEDLVALVEAYAKAQGLFRTPDGEEPDYDRVVEVALDRVEPSLAGPRRPQDRVPLAEVPASFARAWPQARPGATVEMDGRRFTLSDGAVVIAAITSCTNTSNPSVMVAAGLLAKRAVERGLGRAPWVKTSLAPGSRVVTRYLERAGLTPYLEALGFHVTGYGCTTCIGNSGPLPDPVARAIDEHGLTVAAVLSGNRNFEGRIHPQVRANYLASPPLVVAYALAGRVDADFTREPLATDPEGRPVFLRDLWPDPREIADTIRASLSPEMFRQAYEDVFAGDATWAALPVPSGDLFEWNDSSSYIRQPPYFDGLLPEPAPLRDLRGLRVLAVLGDSVTTDHISPAGSIKADSPAGRYLVACGVDPRDFNTYGARRGNHEVMMRGTFANIRLRNLLVPGVEGGFTRHASSLDPLPIYDAAMRYAAEGTPLLVIAGREYGTGSSRDWAAKGTALLGVRAVLAQSFERIHRGNLVGMGVLPLEFLPGDGCDSLGLTGFETYDVEGLRDDLRPRAHVRVRAVSPDGAEKAFDAVARLDTSEEIALYRHGGVLPHVLRSLWRELAANVQR